MTAISPWIVDSMLKVDRAAQLFEELLNRFAAYRDRIPKPFEWHGEHSRDGKLKIITVHIHEPPPVELGAIAGDLVNNLRAALDVMVFQATVRLAGADAKGLLRVAFPAPETRTELNRWLDERPVIPEGIQDFIRAQKPTKEDDSILWALRELDNAHKHRHLLPSLPVGRLKRADGTPLGEFEDLFPGKQFVVPAGVELHASTDAPLAFGTKETEPMFMESAIRSMARTTRRAVESFGELAL